MTTLRDKAWMWGYVIAKSGLVIAKSKEVPFVGPSGCSLETAANYLGIPNAVFLNSNHDKETLRPEYLDSLAQRPKVICALQHGLYEETARQVSKISRQYKNICGGLIDDFLEFHGPSGKMTPEDTRRVQAALKSDNPELKLSVVQYTWQDKRDLEPYLPYIDAINLWVWVANNYDWQVKMGLELENIARKSKKPVLLGLFMHDYGGTRQAIAMDVLETQTKKSVEFAKAGWIEGFVILQSGWFDREDHRPQAQWLKQYLEWAFGT